MTRVSFSNPSALWSMPTARQADAAWLNVGIAVAAAMSLAIAAALPWLSFESAAVRVASIELPTAGLMGALAWIAAASAVTARRWWLCLKTTDGATQRKIVLWAALVAVCWTGHWFAWRLPGEVTFYEYRPAARMMLWCVGIVLLAECVRHIDAVRLVRWIARPRHVAWPIGIAMLLGSVVAWGVLDGMPHVIDAVTYLLQGRLLLTGQLADAAPLYPQLFDDELVFRVRDGAFYSQYPPLWPLVLGLFDRVIGPWAANVALAGIAVGLTHAIVRNALGRRVAWMTAMAMALCPWLWMNAGTQLSHLFSLVLLLAFVWCFERVWSCGSRAAAICAGLALAALVIARPQDGAFFALPCAVACAVMLVRKPAYWVTRSPLIALAALPGLAGYLLVNRALTGDAGRSTYGKDPLSVLHHHLPASLLDYGLWVQESFAALSTQWFAGAFPLVAIVAVAVLLRPGKLRRLRWLLWGTLSLVVCYSFIRFGGRSWVGPRWLVPAIPLLACCVAVAFNGLLAMTRVPRHRAWSRQALVLFFAAVVVTLGLAAPVKLLELRLSPPHGIDGRVAAAAKNAKLTHAVVGLPASGVFADTLQPNYKRGIAGMWTMAMPIDASPVIYVRRVEGWEAMARESWPTRTVYRISDEPGVFAFEKLDAGQDSDVDTAGRGALSASGR